MSIAWLLFWLGGLPHYYRQYSTVTMILFDLVLLPPIWLIVYSRIKRTEGRKYFVASVWLSFYITVPLFLYDLLYCGYYLSRGINFLWEYWYLSVYYLLPWLIFPVTGWIIETHEGRALPADR